MASTFVKFLVLIVAVLLVGIFSNGGLLPIKSCMSAYDFGNGIFKDNILVVDTLQHAYCTGSSFFIFMMVFVLIKALVTHPPGITNQFRKDLPIIFILIGFIILLLPFFYFSLKGVICFNCGQNDDPTELAKERERILLIRNSYLTDTTSASTEQEIRTALEFCDKLRYNREFCFKKIAITILPDHYNESVKICTDERTFNINSRDDKQVYCLLNISSIVNSVNKESKLETCDHGSDPSIVITCYSHMFAQFVNKNQDDTDIIELIVQKCEKDISALHDHCFEEVSLRVGKYASENIRRGLYDICERIESKTSRTTCFLNIKNPKSALREEIGIFCKNDTWCIIDSAYSLAEQRKIDDAITICTDLPDTVDEQGLCLHRLFRNYNAFNELEDIQKMFSTCENVTGLQDFCYEMAAERFSYESDARAIDACTKIKGEKKRCVIEVATELSSRGKLVIAQDACNLLEAQQEKEECLTKVNRK